MKDKKLLAFIIPFSFCILVLAFAYRGYSAEQLAAGNRTEDTKRMELSAYQLKPELVNVAHRSADPILEIVYEGSALLFENPMASSGVDPVYAEWVYEGSAQLEFDNLVAFAKYGK